MRLDNNLDLERCPHCGVSNPNLPYAWQIQTENHSGRNRRNWKIYVCSGCGALITAFSPEKTNEIKEIFPNKISETFDFEYLSGDVKEDFQEALKCYSNNCYNAFAAMCRRTIQSLAKELGAEGKDKISNQLKNLKMIIEIDEETFKILEQIAVAGHDGAHPHLPKLSSERATILLELMKDVLYQLYIRKIKIKDSINLRQKSISESKINNSS